MRELFVYYRIDAAHEAAARAAVQAFHARLIAGYPQLRARLLMRPHAADGPQTWMETYATDPVLQPAGVGPELQAAIEAQAAVLEPMLSGPRHTEAFTACA